MSSTGVTPKGSVRVTAFFQPDNVVARKSFKSCSVDWSEQSVRASIPFNKTLWTLCCWWSQVIPFWHCRSSLALTARITWVDEGSMGRARGTIPALSRWICEWRTCPRPGRRWGQCPLQPSPWAGGWNCGFRACAATPAKSACFRTLRTRPPGSWSLLSPSTCGKEASTSVQGNLARWIRPFKGHVLRYWAL